MADIDVRRTHALGIEGARRAADRMKQSLEERYRLRSAWDGDVLRFEGSGVSGHLAIGERDLHLAVSLGGFMLRAMRGSIEGQVRNEMEKVFGGGHGHVA